MVGDVKITGNEHVSHDQLTAPAGFELRTGWPYSPRRLSEDRNRISATYLNRGYPNAEVKANVGRHPDDPHRVDVTYAIAEHQLVRVGEVVYLGQKQTRLSLLQKTAQLPAEAPIRKVQMLGAETRLYDSNAFDWSSVGPQRPITDQTEEAALVKVHEAKRNEIIYGFGFEVSHRGGNVPSGSVAVPGLPPVNLGSNKIAPSQSTFASPRGSIQFNRRNMRGLGETVSATVLLSRLDERLLTTYAQPHFIGSQWTSLSSFSIERTTENPLFAAGLWATCAATSSQSSFSCGSIFEPPIKVAVQFVFFGGSVFRVRELSEWVLVPEMPAPVSYRIFHSIGAARLSVGPLRSQPKGNRILLFLAVSCESPLTASLNSLDTQALCNSAHLARL